MPRISRRRIPIVDPQTIERPNHDEPEPVIISASLPASIPLGLRKFIDFSEQFVPPDIHAEIMRTATAWKNTDRNGMPMPPEAEILLQSLFSMFAVPSAFKQLRQKFGITQQEIASICDVKHSTVLRWENGQTSFPPQAISALCKVVGDKMLTAPLTGKHIAYVRKKLKFSRRHFAETIGVVEMSIVRWEKLGDHPLTLSASAKVRELYAAELADFAQAA